MSRPPGWSLALFAPWVAVLCATPGEAQVIQPPRRILQPQTDSNRLRQQLTLSIDVLGGAEDNLAPEDASGSEFLTRPGGRTGFAATKLHYRIGQSNRSVEAIGGGFVNAFRNIGLTPVYGGDLAVRGRTGLGQRTVLDVGQNVRSDPFFALDPLNSIQPAAPDLAAGASDASPIDPFTKNRSLSLTTRASLNRRWTRRTTMDLSYNFNDRIYDGGPAFDSRGHVATLAVSRSLGRASGVKASYRYSTFESAGAGGDPLAFEDQTVDVGWQYGKDLSRTRRIELSVGAGAVRQESWGPSGYGTASVDVGRTWTLTTYYRRGVSVLQGVSARPFTTDAADVQLGGRLAGRIAAVFSGTYSNGQTGTHAEASRPGRFDSYAFTGQLSFQVTPWWSAVATYSHYQYALNTVASQTLGISPDTYRNAVRVGFTLQLPLVGSQMEQAP
jgi:hypothetical protein